MATYYVKSGDLTAASSYSTTSNLAGAAPLTAPGTMDDIAFVSGSGTLNSRTTVTVGSVAWLTGATGNLVVFNTTALTLASLVPPGGFLLDLAGSDLASPLSGQGSMVYSGTGAIRSGGKNIAVSGNNTFTGTITLSDAMSLGSTFIQNGGSFVTNGHNISVASLTSSNTTTRTLNLGTSTVTIFGSGNVWNIATSTNLTLTTAQSTIVFSGGTNSTAVTMTQSNIAGLTFNTIRYTGNSAFGGSTGFLMSATNIEITPASSSATVSNAEFVVSAGYTCTNFKAIAFDRGSRIMVRTNAIGTQQTLTVSGSVDTLDASFRDVSFSGAGWAAAANTGNARRTGDAWGNSGFPAGFFAISRTVYTTGGFTTDPNAFSLTPGGAGGEGPALPQDDVVKSGTGTLNSRTTHFCRNYTQTGSGALALNSPADNTHFYGGFNISGASFSAPTNARQIILAGRGNHTMTFNGLGSMPAFTVNAPGGTYSLQDAGSTNGAFNLLAGTFNTNNQNFTASTFGPNVSGTRSFVAGTSTLTLTGTGTIFSCNDSTAASWSMDQMTMVVADTSSASKVISNERGAVSKIGKLEYIVNGGPLVIGGTVSRTYAFGSIKIKGRDSDGTSSKRLNIGVGGSLTQFVCDTVPDLGQEDSFLTYVGGTTPFTNFPANAVLPYTHGQAIRATNALVLGGANISPQNANVTGSSDYPNFIAFTSNVVSTTSTTRVLSFGTSPAAGTRIFLISAADSSGTPSCPGFDLIHFVGPTSGGLYVSILSRVAQAGEPTNYTITWPTATHSGSSGVVLSNATSVQVDTTNLTQNPDGNGTYRTVSLALPRQKSIVIRAISNTSSDRPVSSVSEFNITTTGNFAGGASNAMSIVAQPASRLVSGTERGSYTNGGTLHHVALIVEGSYVAPSAGGKPKVLLSDIWTKKSVKVFLNDQWVEKPMKYHNGTSWVPLT